MSNAQNPPFPYFPDVTESEVGPMMMGVVSLQITEPGFEMFIIDDDDKLRGYQLRVLPKWTDPKVYGALVVGSRVKFRVTKKFTRLVYLSIMSDDE